jgi:integrase
MLEDFWKWWNTSGAWVHTLPVKTKKIGGSRVVPLPSCIGNDTKQYLQKRKFHKQAFIFFHFFRFAKTKNLMQFEYMSSWYKIRERELALVFLLLLWST